MRKKNVVIKVILTVLLLLAIIVAVIRIFQISLPYFRGIPFVLWDFIKETFFEIITIILSLSIQLFEIQNKKNSVNGTFFTAAREVSNFIENKNNLLMDEIPDKYPKDVLRVILKLLEDYLRLYIGKQHFEMSIFTNVEHPDIYAYYDTHGNSQPSSYNNRKNDPNYYRNKKYEAIELLDNPISEIVIISSTETSDYNFINKRQRRKIKSQLMFCFHMTDPYILVVTCSKTNAFMKKDRDLDEFICNIGKMLNSEIVIKENICCRNGFGCQTVS
jgi:hypothetical protein